MIERKEKLGFACVTHYNMDHFSGMFEVMRDKSMLTRGHFFHNGFEWCDAYPEIGFPQLNEMKRIEETLHRGTHPFVDWPVVGGQMLELSENVSIQFLAPSASRRASLLRTLIRNATSGSFSPRPFNRISIAFLLKYGKASILFSGDIDGPSWRRIRDDNPALRPCWVKVSQHGSRAGNPKWLWPWLAGDGRGNKVHAAISADGIRYPSPAVLKEIARYAVVHTTYQSSGESRPASPRNALEGPAAVDAWGPHSPTEILLEAAHIGGRVCEFAVYPDGSVVASGTGENSGSPISGKLIG
jgi:hypothetical protein